MKIGIIGPTKIKHFCKAANFDPAVYLGKIMRIVKIIAQSENEIIVVPEKKSISEVISLEYKKTGGKKSYGMIPMDDTEFGHDYLNQDAVDEIINCSTWRNQPAMFAQEADILLSFGFGPGTVGEICSTKWWKVDKVIIIEDFITPKTPNRN